MIKKEIHLTPLSSIGSCKALIEDSFVSVRSCGVAGCLKAWLTGKENSKEIGNLVNGAIDKKIDVSSYSGILITQSGRQMFYGKFKDDDIISPPEEETPDPAIHEEAKNDTPPEIFSFNDGFSWQEITNKTYPSDSPLLCYILSRRSFYNAFLLHGRYYYGEKGSQIAVAVECDLKNEPHPFFQLSPYSVLRDGYMIISADTDTKNFCNYEY